MTMTKAKAKTRGMTAPSHPKTATTAELREDMRRAETRYEAARVAREASAGVTVLSGLPSARGAVETTRKNLIRAEGERHRELKNARGKLEARERHEADVRRRAQAAAAARETEAAQEALRPVFRYDPRPRERDPNEDFNAKLKEVRARWPRRS